MRKSMKKVLNVSNGGFETYHRYCANILRHLESHNRETGSNEE